MDLNKVSFADEDEFLKIMESLISRMEIYVNGRYAIQDRVVSSSNDKEFSDHAKNGIDVEVQALNRRYGTHIQNMLLYWQQLKNSTAENYKTISNQLIKSFNAVNEISKSGFFEEHYLKSSNVCPSKDELYKIRGMIETAVNNKTKKFTKQEAQKLRKHEYDEMKKVYDSSNMFGKFAMRIGNKKFKELSSEFSNSSMSI